MKTPLPLCACGVCGRRVTRRRNRWATPHCVPRHVRQTAAAKGGMLVGRRVQKRLYDAVFADLERRYGNRVTKAALYEAFAAVREAGYQAGYQACAMKHRRALARQAKVA